MEWRIFGRSLKRIEPVVAKAIKEDRTLTKGLGDNPPRLCSAIHGESHVKREMKSTPSKQRFRERRAGVLLKIILWKES